MRHFVLALVLLLAACNQQPQNIADFKQTLVIYHDSGAYMRDVENVMEDARKFIAATAPRTEKPAIVLDVDETALSNWTEMFANTLNHIPDGPCNKLPDGPCGRKAWQAKAQGTVLQPTLDLFNDAKSRNVAVFFITGRDESLRAATEKNLKALGYEGYVKLIMRPRGSTTVSAADYKAPERAKIEALGYTIIAAIGDQQSDLDGGYLQRPFLVPNPFYRIH